MYLHIICIYASLGIENFECMKILFSKLLLLLHTCQILFGDCSCSTSSSLNVKHVLAVLWPGIKFWLKLSVGIKEIRIETEQNFEMRNGYSFVRYKHENEILFQNTIFAMLKQCSVKNQVVVGKWTIREVSFILLFSATVILLTYVPSTLIRQSCHRALSEQVTLNALVPLLQCHLMPFSSGTWKCCQATVTCRQLCDIYYPSIRVLLAVKQKLASISM